MQEGKEDQEQKVSRQREEKDEMEKEEIGSRRMGEGR